MASYCDCIELAKRRHWRPPGRDIVSEYKTYSESEVKVYRDDKLLSSTDTGVSSAIFGLDTFEWTDRSLILDS